MGQRLRACIPFQLITKTPESVDGDTEEMRLYIVFKSSPPECNWSPNVTYELVMQRGDQVHTFMLLLSALYSLKSRLRFSYKYKALDRDGRELWSSPFSEIDLKCYRVLQHVFDNRDLEQTTAKCIFELNGMPQHLLQHNLVLLVATKQQSLAGGALGAEQNVVHRLRQKLFDPTLSQTLVFEKTSAVKFHLLLNSNSGQRESAVFFGEQFCVKQLDEYPVYIFQFDFWGADISNVQHEHVPVVHEELPSGEGLQECRICMSNASSCVFVPCGHCCACQVCASKMHKCPICQQDIALKQRVYFS